ncbi:MAG TPA: response regulator transcription factor [Dehalococcoidales bacterium]|nr:response regulator transcription factor [Dehalococcoidales bacterium]
MPGKRVLVVDDDVKTVELVKLYLNRDGYRVLTAYDGVEALRLAREGHPDLIVLDLMLPGIDGLEICRTLRNESDVPIIMLTARTTDEDKLTGLDMGADDYVTKPFSPRELAARIRAILRRLPGERGPSEIKYGKLTLNFLKHEAYLCNRFINLTAVEFKLLGVFAREPGRVFSRAQLIEKALGHDFEGFDRTIDVHILNLRRKLEPDPRHPRYLKTVYGAGYKLSVVNDDI